MNTGRGRWTVILVFTFALVLSGTSPAPAATSVLAQVKSAKTMLSKLKIKSLTYPDYDRERDFGNAWVDVNRNGCDTRNDILKRDLTSEIFNDSCEIASGKLLNRYTGKSVKFVRGRGTSQLVPIDHIIPLHLAWQLGANKWGFGKRVTFANDPLNLQATDLSSNSSKSDSGPDEWLPANQTYRCTYVIKFTRVAYMYQLAITSAMKAAISKELNTCKTVIGSPATGSPLAPSVWNYASSIG